MRKITSLIFALLCLCNTVAWAQPSDFGDPLITDSAQVTSPYYDESEGTDISLLIDGDFNTFWHSDWHNRVPADYHWVQFELPEVMDSDIVFWMKRRATTNDHPSVALLTGALTPDFMDEVLIDTLYMEASATNAGEFTSDVLKLPTAMKYIRFTPIACLPTDPGFRVYWHAAEINLYHPEEYAVYQKMMTDFLNGYDAWLWGEDPNLGTEIGQYADAESFNKFLELLTKISQILAEEIERPSNEEIEALVAEAQAAYDAYIASRVGFTLAANGYYRIIANLDYYKDVETGELDEFGNPLTERTEGIKKSMYSKLEGTAAWHTYDATDCRDIWHLTQNADGTVTMINAATEMGFYSPAYLVGMTTEADSMKAMRFELAGIENERQILYIKFDGETNVLHQMSHSRGAGEGDNLTTWIGTFNMDVPYESDKGTSEWYLEAVPAEEAQALIDAYAVIKDHDLLVLQYRDILSQAKAGMTIANEAYSQAYITKNEQFSSAVTETAEGSLNNLLDGDQSTFWHSAWSGDYTGTTGGTHFLDITLDEPIEGNIYAWIQRRTTDNDHPITWSVYGSNDEASLSAIATFPVEDADLARAQTIEGWTLIADSLSTPYDVNVIEVYTPEFNVPTPYKYLRFVGEEMTGKSGFGTRGFFHMSGFQIYKTLGRPQIETMGEVGTTMIAEIEKGDAIEDANITLEDLNALKAAYEAFKALLADPTNLRNAVLKYANTADMLAIGEEPGFWSSDAEALALQAAVTAANEYDKGGSYTQTQLDEHVATIEAAVTAFTNAANKISTDKWYRLRFPTIETFEQYGWETTSAGAQDGYIYGDLFGKYAAVSSYLENDDYMGLITTKETEEMTEGDGLYMDALENITNEDASLFRFVAIGDSAYVIQNKATGLYINAAGANTQVAVTLSLDPTVYNVIPVGYGCVLLNGKSLAGESRNNLHVKKYTHALVTWEANTAGSNSGMWLETAGDVEGEVANQFVRNLESGKIYSVCHPTGIKPAEEGTDLSLYTVAGTYTEGEESFIALNTIAETKAGEPYIAIVGSTEDYIEPAEGEEVSTEPFIFSQVGDGFAPKAGYTNGLVGLYNATFTAPAGSVVFVNNTATVAEDKVVEDAEGNFTATSNRTVGAYSAWLSFGITEADPAGTYDLVLQIGGTPTADGIQNTLQNVAKSGTIYDLSGRQVKANGTLNDIKSLGRGIYILNGT